METVEMRKPTKNTLREIRRAGKAAMDLGLEISSLEVEDGKFRFGFGKATETTPGKQANPWDEALNDDAVPEIRRRGPKA